MPKAARSNVVNAAANSGPVSNFLWRHRSAWWDKAAIGFFRMTDKVTGVAANQLDNSIAYHVQGMEQSLDYLDAINNNYVLPGMMALGPYGRIPEVLDVSFFQAVAGARMAANTTARGLGAIAYGMRTKLFGAKGLDSASVITKHPLEGWTSQQVVDHINQLGLKTPRDQLILWSALGRGNAGVKLSQEYAAFNGGITLEMTPGGKWLDLMDLFGANSPFTRAQAGQIWENVSTRMIQQASGQVRSLIGTVNPSSVYRAEQMELLMNNNILGLDELNLKPRFGFGNN